MEFTTVILMGDSGGSQGAMKEVAALNEKYKGAATRFHFVPEYYQYSAVQKLIKESGIPDQIEIGGQDPRRVRHRRDHVSRRRPYISRLHLRHDQI